MVEEKKVGSDCNERPLRSHSGSSSGYSAPLPSTLCDPTSQLNASPCVHAFDIYRTEGRRGSSAKYERDKGKGRGYESVNGK